MQLRCNKHEMCQAAAGITQHTAVCKYKAYTLK